MNALEVARRSIDAWNSHDPDAIVALYAEGGTYTAPRGWPGGSYREGHRRLCKSGVEGLSRHVPRHH